MLVGRSSLVDCSIGSFVLERVHQITRGTPVMYRNIHSANVEDNDKTLVIDHQPTGLVLCTRGLFYANRAWPSCAADFHGVGINIHSQVIWLPGGLPCFYLSSFISHFTHMFLCPRSRLNSLVKSLIWQQQLVFCFSFRGRLLTY